MASNSTKGANPKVSVIMPCFNAAEYLPATLASLQAQSFQDYELILIDDASTDNTLALLQEWQQEKPKVKLIPLTENVGPGAARNIGIARATANLISLLDADDIWYPEKLAVQYALHQATQCVFSCTAFKYGRTTVLQESTDYRSLLKNNVVNTSTVMFDHAQLKIEFKSEYKSEDYMAWLDVARDHKIEFINQVLAERIEVDGLSANKFEMAVQRWRVYRQHQKLDFFQSTYYFLHYAISGLAKYAKMYF